jgi:putative transposase
VRKSYKYRLYPNKEQTEKLSHSLDLLREIYNAGLQERRDAWQMNRIQISYFDQSKQVSDIRTLNTDYLAVQSRTIRQTLRQLDKSFAAFFRRLKSGERPGYPRFKGRNFFNSIIYNLEGFRLIGNRLRLSKIGDIKIRLSRPIEGTIKEVLAKREGDKWYAIISCDNVPERPLAPTGEVIGIDVGIESFATLSDGTQIENWKYYEAGAKKMRTAQRRIARRTKGSNRRRKTVAQLRNVHQKIVNQRNDFQHKLSTHLIAHYDLIAVEKLNIKGLAKSRLSKQILDASWSSFFHMLRYKAESADRKLVEVKPHFTSQDCSACGNRVKKALSERMHNCCNCGLLLHRDHNAALNILRLGQSLQDVTYRATESVS